MKTKTDKDKDIFTNFTQGKDIKTIVPNNILSQVKLTQIIPILNLSEKPNLIIDIKNEKMSKKASNKELSKFEDKQACYSIKHSIKNNFYPQEDLNSGNISEWSKEDETFVYFVKNEYFKDKDEFVLHESLTNPDLNPAACKKIIWLRPSEYIREKAVQEYIEKQDLSLKQQLTIRSRIRNLMSKINLNSLNSVIHFHNKFSKFDKPENEEEGSSNNNKNTNNIYFDQNNSEDNNNNTNLNSETTKAKIFKSNCNNTQIVNKFTIDNALVEKIKNKILNNAVKEIKEKYHITETKELENNKESDSKDMDSNDKELGIPNRTNSFVGNKFTVAKNKTSNLNLISNRSNRANTNNKFKTIINKTNKNLSSTSNLQKLDGVFGTNNSKECQQQTIVSQLTQEIEDELNKYDEYITVYLKVKPLKFFSVSERLETAEENENRISALENLEKERVNEENIKNKKSGKKTKIVPLEIDKGYQVIKKALPSKLSLNDKLPLMSRWITSNLQMIIDLDIKDAYTNMSIFSKVFPQEEGTTIFNPDGFYYMQLYYQGRSVKVVVDDLMPLSENYDFLFPRCENIEELWPAIITKCLTKLYSHMFAQQNYDIVGDMSFIYSLTGYLGENCILNSVNNTVLLSCNYDGNVLDNIKKQAKLQSRITSNYSKSKIFSSSSSLNKFEDKEEANSSFDDENNNKNSSKKSNNPLSPSTFSKIKHNDYGLSVNSNANTSEINKNTRENSALAKKVKINPNAIIASNNNKKLSFNNTPMTENNKTKLANSSYKPTLSMLDLNNSNSANRLNSINTNSIINENDNALNSIKNSYTYELFSLIKNNIDSNTFKKKKKILGFYKFNQADQDEINNIELKRNGFLSNILNKVEKDFSKPNTDRENENEKEDSQVLKEVIKQKDNEKEKSNKNMLSIIADEYNNSNLKINHSDIDSKHNTNNIVNNKTNQHKKSSNKVTPSKFNFGSINSTSDKNYSKENLETEATVKEDTKILIKQSDSQDQKKKETIDKFNSKISLKYLNKLSSKKSNIYIDSNTEEDRRKSNKRESNKQENVERNENPFSEFDLMTNKLIERSNSRANTQEVFHSAIASLNSESFSNKKSGIHSKLSNNNLDHTRQTSLNNFNYLKIFKGSNKNLTRLSSKDMLKKESKFTKPHNPKYKNYFINYFYPLTDFFDSTGFNMNRLDPIEFRDLKEEYLRVKNTINYKTLTREQKITHRENIEKLGNDLKEKKQKRLDEIALPGRRFLFFKLKCDAQGNQFPSLISFSEDKIEMGKRCLINNWKFPPLDYIQSVVRENEMKNDFYKDRVARIKSQKNLNSETTQMKNTLESNREENKSYKEIEENEDDKRKKKQKKIGKKTTFNIKNNYEENNEDRDFNNTNEAYNKTRNNNSPLKLVHNDKEEIRAGYTNETVSNTKLNMSLSPLKLKKSFKNKKNNSTIDPKTGAIVIKPKEIPRWKKYYNEFTVNIDKAIYNNPILPPIREGKWVQSEDFTKIFNKVAIFHNPGFYKSSIRIRVVKTSPLPFNQDSCLLFYLRNQEYKNINHDMSDILEDHLNYYEIAESLNSNNKFNKNKSSLLIVFEPLLSYNKELQKAYIVFDVVNLTNQKKVYKDIILQSTFSVIQLDELSFEDNYVLIVKGGVFPLGFNISILSDHELSHLSEEDYLVNVLNYNFQKFKIIIPEILETEEQVFARFRINIDNIENISLFKLKELIDCIKSFLVKENFSSSLENANLIRLFVKYNNENVSYTNMINSYLKIYINETLVENNSIPYEILLMHLEQQYDQQSAIINREENKPNEELEINHTHQTNASLKLHKNTNTNTANLQSDSKVNIDLVVSLISSNCISLPPEEVSISFVWNSDIFKEFNEMFNISCNNIASEKINNNNNKILKSAIKNNNRKNTSLNQPIEKKTDFSFEMLEWTSPFKVKDKCRLNRDGILMKEFVYLKDIVYLSLNLRVFDLSPNKEAKDVDAHQINNIFGFHINHNNTNTSNSHLSQSNVNNNYDSKSNIYGSSKDAYNNQANNNIHSSQMLANSLKQKKLKRIAFNFFDKQTTNENIYEQDVNELLTFTLKIENDNETVFEQDFHNSIFIPYIKFEGIIDNCDDGNKKNTNKKSQIANNEFNNTPYLITLSTQYSEIVDLIFNEQLFSLNWEIKVYPSNTLVFIIDDRKEVNQQQMIENWENEEPGRGLIANTSRVKYLIALKKKKNKPLTEEEQNILSLSKEDLLKQKINKLGGSSNNQSKKHPNTNETTNNKSKKLNPIDKNKNTLNTLSDPNSHPTVSQLYSSIPNLKNFDTETQKIKFSYDDFVSSSIKEYYSHYYNSPRLYNNVFEYKGGKPWGYTDTDYEHKKIYIRKQLINQHNNKLKELHEELKNSSKEQNYIHDFSHTQYNFRALTENSDSKHQIVQSLATITQGRSFFSSNVVKKHEEKRVIEKEKSILYFENMKYLNFIKQKLPKNINSDISYYCECLFNGNEYIKNNSIIIDKKKNKGDKSIDTKNNTENLVNVPNKESKNDMNKIKPKASNNNTKKNLTPEAIYNEKIEELKTFLNILTRIKEKGLSVIEKLNLKNTINNENNLEISMIENKYYNKTNPSVFSINLANINNNNSNNNSKHNKNVSVLSNNMLKTTSTFHKNGVSVLNESQNNHGYCNTDGNEKPIHPKTLSFDNIVLQDLFEIISKIKEKIYYREILELRKQSNLKNFNNLEKDMFERIHNELQEYNLNVSSSLMQLINNYFNGRNFTKNLGK